MYFLHWLIQVVVDCCSSTNHKTSSAIRRWKFDPNVSKSFWHFPLPQIAKRPGIEGVKVAKVGFYFHFLSAFHWAVYSLYFWLDDLAFLNVLLKGGLYCEWGNLQTVWCERLSHNPVLQVFMTTRKTPVQATPNTHVFQVPLHLQVRFYFTQLAISNKGINLRNGKKLDTFSGDKGETGLKEYIARSVMDILCS